MHVPLTLLNHPKKKKGMALHTEDKRRNWINAKAILSASPICEPSEDQYWFSGDTCSSVTHTPERKTLIIYCHTRADAWCATQLAPQWWCSMTTSTWCEWLCCFCCTDSTVLAGSLRTRWSWVKFKKGGKLIGFSYCKQK